MKIINYRRIYFLMDIILIFILILSVINNFEKSAIPSDISGKSNFKITKVNNISTNSDYEVEYIIDRYVIGRPIDIEYSFNGRTYRTKIKLVPYYNFFFGVVFVFTLLIFLLIGIYVIRKRYNDQVSRVFHNVVFAAAFLIGTTWGRINLYDNFIDVLLRVLYDYSYLWLGVNMLHFSFVFPREKKIYRKKFFFLLYCFIFLVSLYISYIHYHAIINYSIDDFRYYLHIEDVVIPGFFIIFILSAIFSFLHSYKSYKTSYDRQKIRWILTGIVIAPLNFILLWLLPRKLIGFPLIPEWLMLLLTTLAPISFYISIFRYRLFNIDIILSRSSVYSAVIILIIGIYILFQKIFEYIILYSQNSDIKISTVFVDILRNPNLPVFVSFVFVTLFYGMVLKKFQNFVDRKFFSETYRQKQTNEIFAEDLKDVLSIENIGNLTFSSLQKSINTEKLGLIMYDLDGNSEIFSRYSNIYGMPNSFKKSLIHLLKNGSFRVVADDTAIENGYKFQSTSIINQQIPGIILYLFSFSNDGSKVSVVLAGDKTNHFRFSHEEIDASLYKTDRAIDSINRFFLINNLIAKENENKRLEELNNMKTYFLSSVTHELKTPLTSIKIYAELMQNSDGNTQIAKKDYLEIIQNECNRLENLINNVLDFSKIEYGIKEYNFAKINLVHVVKSVLALMKFQFEKNGFEVINEILIDNAVITADFDAISEVLINILTNSIKYSDNAKFINVSLHTANEHYVLSVEDKGTGIAEKDLTRIFDAFYRAETVKTSSAGGAGIGLSIVKSIIEAHNADIEIKSKLGKGTKINLYFKQG